MVNALINYELPLLTTNQKLETSGSLSHYQIVFNLISNSLKKIPIFVKKLSYGS